MKFKVFYLSITFTLFMLGGLFSQEDENITRVTKNLTFAGFESADGVVDVKLNFNENWLFHLGELPGFHQPEYNDKNWRVLTVPHDWSVEGKIDQNNPSGIRGGFLPMGIGCYRKMFVLDENAKGKRIKIRFDGVYMNSSVYINGVFLGNRPYGFSTFEYDLTQYLKFNGEENVIAVKVDNSLQPNCRWYSGSGINRNVHLYIMEQQHFQSFKTFFHTDSILKNIAYTKVDFEVKSNNYPESQHIKFQLYPNEVEFIRKDSKVIASLKDMGGKKVAETSNSFELRDYETKNFSFDLAVENPSLWSDKTPNLYELELQLWVEGKLVNTEIQNVGIRMIEFNKDQGMLVNGEKVIVKGLCLHKDAGSFGTAVPKDVWRFRLEKLKKMGCNSIRTHGPVDPIFIEVCDEMGFYMMAESFDEWQKSWEYGLSEDPSGKLPYSYHKYFKQWAETDLKDMIKRDRNHPSVFMYSVGNEVPEQRFDEGPKTLERLMKWAKEEDHTRPVIAACDWSMWANQTGFMDEMDIAGYNYPDRYFKEHYREEHAKYPNRIFLGTENYIDLENWLMVRDNPYVVGLFLWVGIDYLGESRSWPRRSWEWGLIDLATFEKSFYYNWQAYWSEKPMVHTAVLIKDPEPFKWRPFNMASHWNFKPKEIDTVFVFSNTKEVELFQNGESLGRKKVDPDTYTAIYTVDYRDGELKANAFNGTKKVANHVLKTAKDPEKLVIINQRTNQKFVKEELIFLAVEVQDDKGIRHPFAKNEITVSVEGAGELIGLDSGDAFSHELYKQKFRKAHEGRLLLTVRPTDTGEIKISCTSDDLKGAELEISIH